MLGLMFGMLGKTISQKIGFNISCKGDNLHERSKLIFFENKKNTIILSSAELHVAHRVVKVKLIYLYNIYKRIHS